MRPTLVDTSAWIEALRAEGNEEVRDRVRRLLASGDAVFCDLVLLELWNGVRGGAERRYLAALEEDLELLETTGAVWQRSRELARRCRERGRTVPATDLLIFACSEVHGCRLLHKDRHFDQIAEVS